MCPEHKKRELKTFTNFIHDDEDLESNKCQLNESSKALALSQQARFNSTKTQLKSVISKIQSAARAAKTADETSDKIDRLSDAIIQFSEALELEAEMSSNLINVAVVSVIATDDLQVTLSRARK